MPDPLPPNNVLPPNDPPSPAAPDARIRCEFCECQLTPTGGAFRLSDRARVLRDQEEEIRRLKEALGQAEAAGETIKRDLDAVRAQLAELGAGKPARGGW